MFLKILLTLILLVIFSFAENSKPEELKRLLAIIQGTFNDKIYTITIQKSKEYLKKTPENDKYREKVIEILSFSYVKTGNTKEFLKLLNNLENLNISAKTKINIYKLALSYFKNKKKQPQILVKLYKLTKDKKYIILSANILYKRNNWEEIIKLPSVKEINHIKAFAYYKLKKYKDMIDFSKETDKFLEDKLDDIYYYRGLSYIKSGEKEKGIKEFEKIKIKSPEILMYIADFYVKNSNYKEAEKYLKLLSLDEKSKGFALFYLGYINEKQKRYKEAYKFYKKLLESDDKKYSELAFQKILQLKAKKLIHKEKFFSIRVVLYKKEKTAKNFIVKNKLSSCFIYPFKNYYAVYCGLYLNKKEAIKSSKKLKEKLKIKDVLPVKIDI